uniref:Uncharacterized protein n=1 Tax=Dunaliella tertiolecta TaxID=3047 RepID=A0A7S3R1Z9_DUNTE|eukprot:1158848-Pelagomonas_calceolata.AAC.15
MLLGELSARRLHGPGLNGCAGTGLSPVSMSRGGGGVKRNSAGCFPPQQDCISKWLQVLSYLLCALSLPQCTHEFLVQPDSQVPSLQETVHSLLNSVGCATSEHPHDTTSEHPHDK